MGSSKKHKDKESKKKRKHRSRSRSPRDKEKKRRHKERSRSRSRSPAYPDPSHAEEHGQSRIDEPKRSRTDNLPSSLPGMLFSSIKLTILQRETCFT